MSLSVFDIQKFSVHDGPGIRTSVFLKGCSLACYWCHNPESKITDMQMLYYKDKCIGCGKCVKVCPQHANKIKDGVHEYNRKKCICCGGCVRMCPQQAFELAGYNIETEELLAKIVRDRLFYEKTSGGVTFTGGEPLAQMDGLRDTAKKCKEQGIHTAIETSLMAPQEDIQALIPYIDLWICDLKAYSCELHKKGTGAGNQLILQNLTELETGRAKCMWARIPLIPGFNDSKDEFEKMAGLLNKYEFERVEIMPYHAIGRSKTVALYGIDIGAPIEVPDADRVTFFKTILETNGVVHLV